MRSKLTAPMPSQSRSYGDVSGTTAAVIGMFTYPSVTAARTWTATNAVASSERFLCSPLTANRGSPGSRPCLVTSSPSNMTAVSSSSATTPVARLVYQSAVEELIPLTISRIASRSTSRAYKAPLKPL